MKVSFIILMSLISLFSLLNFKGSEVAIWLNSPALLEAAIKVGHHVNSNSNLIEHVVSYKKFAPLNESSKKLIEVLVKKGGDIDAPAKITKNSALISATQKLDVSTIELLLSLGAKPDYSNVAGETALLIACGQSGIEAKKAINLLADYKADFNATNNDGDDCLSLARKHFQGRKSNNPDREIIAIIESKLRG